MQNPESEGGSTLCVICREVLGDDPLAITALPCAHVFHTYCINNYADARNCSIEHACVYRCHTTSWVLEVDNVVTPTAQRTIPDTRATDGDREAAAQADTETENWFG